MTQPKFKLLIMDWNGTIQDDAHYLYECGAQRIFRHYGVPCPSFDDFRRQVKADFMASFYWPNGIPRDATAADLNRIMDEGFKEKGRPADLFPDAVEAVRELQSRGYRQVVLSGFEQAKLTAAVARAGLVGCFDLIQGDVRDKPAAIARLMERKRLTGPQVAAVGDTAEDALAAAAVGGTAFIIPRGFHLRESIEALQDKQPSIVIVESLANLLQHLP